MVRDLGIPVVLAMTGKVSIATAQALAGPFYKSLVRHGLPDRALGEALAGLAEKADFNVPALFTRQETTQPHREFQRGISGSVEIKQGATENEDSKAGNESSKNAQGAVIHDLPAAGLEIHIEQV
jgi:hypothetical protein